jgi:hypothetical protein
MGCACRQTRPAAFPVATYLPCGHPRKLECVGQAQQGWRRGLQLYRRSGRTGEDSRAVGLIVTGMGEGVTIPVESIASPGSGHLKLTGSLGEVRPELIRAK